MMKEKISVPDPEILPKSEDYGWRLSALDPALKPEILPISEAVSNTYRQLTYTMNLMETARETSPV